MQFETSALLWDMHRGKVLPKSEVSQVDCDHRNVDWFLERGNML